MGTLYESICSLCEKRGVSGYRMCKDIGIQPSIVTDLKSGRKKGLSADTAQKIADYFGVTTGYLLGRENGKSPAPEGAELSEARMKLLAAIDGMSEDEVFAVIQLAEAAKRMRGSHG